MINKWAERPKEEEETAQSAVDSQRQLSVGLSAQLAENLPLQINTEEPSF